MSPWLGVYRSRTGIAIAIAAFAFVVVCLLRTAGLLQAAELARYDFELRTTTGSSSREPPITLVLIDERDLRRFGHPLPDDTLRELISLLLASRARAASVLSAIFMPCCPRLTGSSSSCHSPARPVVWSAERSWSCCLRVRA